MANKERLGCSGLMAEVGDVVEVVKGRKYPIGMKMVVCGFDAWCKYSSHNNLFQAYGEKQIVFGGEGKMESIRAENTKIIALNENRDDPEYKNVHKMECYA